jgi:murein DD-endopeptidase MepM/ murein hydrolase activator NlpD
MNRGSRAVAIGIIGFCAGVGVDSWLRVYGPPRPVQRPTMPEANAADAPAVPPSEPQRLPDAAGAEVQQGSRHPAAAGTTGRARLRMPIDGIDVGTMKGGFFEPRAGHRHEAVDILSPRNTPVHAVDDGRVAKLFVSKAGGNTIYQFDRTDRLVYYYAHLERYAPRLREGNPVHQGDVIGFVGTSGNAPPDTPHLHFAVFALGPDKHWWDGTAIDPYEVFTYGFEGATEQ